MYYCTLYLRNILSCYPPYSQLLGKCCRQKASRQEREALSTRLPIHSRPTEMRGDRRNDDYDGDNIIKSIDDTDGHRCSTDHHRNGKWRRQAVGADLDVLPFSCIYSFCCMPINLQPIWLDYISSRIFSSLIIPVQGWAVRSFPGCENAAYKLKQKW